MYKWRLILIEQNICLNSTISNRINVSRTLNRETFILLSKQNVVVNTNGTEIEQWRWTFVKNNYSTLDMHRLIVGIQFSYSSYHKSLVMFDDFFFSYSVINNWNVMHRIVVISRKNCHFDVFQAFEFIEFIDFGL